MGRYYCGGLWGGVVSCDGMVGSADPVGLVGETCLLTVGAQGLVGSPVVGCA